MASASDDPSVARAKERRTRPTLTARLPEDWFFKESLTLLAPAGDANVITSSEPVPDDLDSEAYAKVQGDILQNEFPGYHEHAFEPAVLFGGRKTYVRRFEWSPEEAAPVMQIQIYYAEGGRGYTATATTPRDNFDSVELKLTEILEGLSIDPDQERRPERPDEAGSAQGLGMGVSSEQARSPASASGEALAFPDEAGELEA